MDHWKDRLTTLMAEHGVSEIQLSRALGKSHAYINHLMKGRVGPSISILQTIADHFGIALSSFFAAHDGGTGRPVFTLNGVQDNGLMIHLADNGFIPKSRMKQKTTADVQAVAPCPWELPVSAFFLLMTDNTMDEGSKEQSYPQGSLVAFVPVEKEPPAPKLALFYDGNDIIFRCLEGGYIRTLNPQYPAEKLGSKRAWKPMAAAVGTLTINPLPPHLSRLLL